MGTGKFQINPPPPQKKGYFFCSNFNNKDTF